MELLFANNNYADYEIDDNGSITPRARYSWTAKYRSYFTFDDIQEFKTFRSILLKDNTIPYNKSIPASTTKQKIYISDGSAVPALLLSRLINTYPTINLKRSVKQDKADFIAVNFNGVLEHIMPNDYYSGRVQLIIKRSNQFGDFAVRDYTYLTNMTDTSRLVEVYNKAKSQGLDPKFAIGVSVGPEICKLLADAFVHPEKYVDDYAVVQCLWDNMIKLTPEMAQTILGELSSKDIGTRTKAVDTLCIFNWGEYMFDVYKTIQSNYAMLYAKTDSQLNKNEEFLMFCLNTRVDEMRRRYRRDNNGYWTSVPSLTEAKLPIFKSPLYVPIPYEKAREEVFNALGNKIANDYAIKRELSTLQMDLHLYYTELAPEQKKYNNFADNIVEKVVKKVQEMEDGVCFRYNFIPILTEVND